MSEVAVKMEKAVEIFDEAEHGFFHVLLKCMDLFERPSLHYHNQVGFTFDRHEQLGSNMASVYPQIELIKDRAMAKEIASDVLEAIESVYGGVLSSNSIPKHCNYGNLLLSLLSKYV